MLHFEQAAILFDGTKEEAFSSKIDVTVLFIYFFFHLKNFKN